MSIAVGDKMPEGILGLMGANGPDSLATGELFLATGELFLADGNGAYSRGCGSTCAV